MHQSKLIELLHKLSARQLTGLGEFLQSPLFNKNTDNLLFFNFLRPFSPGFDAPALSKNKVCQALGLEERSLAYRMSELLKLAEQYLLVERLLDSPLEQQLGLMEIFCALRLPKHYDAAKRKTHKLAGQYPYRDDVYLDYLRQITALENRYSQQYERSHNQALQDAADALDAAYLAKKLRYSLEMVNASKVLEINYDLNLGEAALQWVQQKSWEVTPAVGIYLHALLLLQKPEDEAHFLQLRQLLQEHESTLPPAELKNLYTYLLNHCTYRINQRRDDAYYGYFLEINEILLSKGLLLEEGQLAPWRYSNLMTVSLRTGRLEWAYQFLNQYKNYLPEDFRENIYGYNLAHYLYWLKAYDRAQTTLNQLDLRDPLLAVAAKNLLAKIYYETGQTELLLSFLEAYRLYIYRHPLVKPKLKLQTRNFIDFTRKLAKLAPFEKEKRQKLADSLPPATEVLEWEWLEVKVKG